MCIFNLCFNTKMPCTLKPIRNPEDHQFYLLDPKKMLFKAELCQFNHTNIKFNYRSKRFLPNMPKLANSCLKNNFNCFVSFMLAGRFSEQWPCRCPNIVPQSAILLLLLCFKRSGLLNVMDPSVGFALQEL